MKVQKIGVSSAMNQFEDSMKRPCRRYPMCWCEDILHATEVFSTILMTDIGHHQLSPLLLEPAVPYLCPHIHTWSRVGLHSASQSDICASIKIL